LDLPHVAQIPNRVSAAKRQTLSLSPIRHDPNGCPLSPAVMAKERSNVTPLSGCGRRQGERFRLHTAGFPPRNNAMPPFVGHGSRSLFVVVAAVR
jgi:hypothetical protein